MADEPLLQVRDLKVHFPTADGVVKSNRNRPGALSEPACAAESPSERRNAACSRCVAE